MPGQGKANGQGQEITLLAPEDVTMLNNFLKRTLCRLLGCHEPAPSVQAHFTIGPVELKRKGE